MKKEIEIILWDDVIGEGVSAVLYEDIREVVVNGEVYRKSNRHIEGKRLYVRKERRNGLASRIN